MIDAICLYERDGSPALRPLTWLRPAFDLRCGIWTPLERLRRLCPDRPLTARIASPWNAVLPARYGLPEEDLQHPARTQLNGALLLAPDSLRALPLTGSSSLLLLAENGVAGAVLAHEEDALRFSIVRDEGHDLAALPWPTVDLPGARLIEHPWDVIRENAPMIEDDASLWEYGVHPGATVHPSAVLDGTAIHIGEGARIGALAVLDATHGPVIVDSRAEVLPHAVLAGPVYVGPHCRIKYGAKIYEGVSLGPWCKAGGEIEGTVFHSFANKQHEGFVGHSYIAPWVNLGADTNTSDLKNTYSEIRMTCEGREQRTGMMFLGTIFADHVKTGINTMLNTGSCFGVGCNVFGGDFPPKDLPSFSWGSASGIESYDLDRFLATAEKVMARRSQILDEEERSLLVHVHHETEPLRKIPR